MKINIREVVKSKNHNLFKKIPSFMFVLFEKLICQNQINQMLSELSDLRGVDFATGVLNYINVRRVIKETTPIESYCDRPIIFVANHPLGGIDGLAIAEHINSKFGDVKVVVNDILMNIHQLKDIFIPVNKHGRQSSVNVELLNSAFESNIPILYFPAGLCSRKINGKVTDLPWKNNFIKKAIEFDRDIVPIRVDCLNSRFFYNFALARKILGIKVNIEMVLLPSEVFKKRNKDITLIFGNIQNLKKHKNSSNNINYLVKIARESCYSL